MYTILLPYSSLALQVEEVDSRLLAKFSYQASGDLSPMQAVIGSIAAQEVMKVRTYMYICTGTTQGAYFIKPLVTPRAGRGGFPRGGTEGFPASQFTNLSNTRVHAQIHTHAHIYINTQCTRNVHAHTFRYLYVHVHTYHTHTLI